MEKLQPKLRFPEFESDWKIQKLGKISNFINGKAFNQPELKESGKYPVLRVGNLFTNNNWYYSDLELDGSKYIDCGDLIYAWSATFGPRIWNDGKVIYHYHIWKVECGYSINKLFFYHLLDNETLRMKNNSSNGFALLHITKGTIENWTSSFPTLPEQQKIASFLSTVDEKINLLKKQLSLLEQYKKGVMQKIFSREIRFKDEDGKEFPDWEERKVSDIFRITRGNVLSVTKMELQEKNEYCYPVFSSQTKNGGVCGFYNEYLFENAITWTTDGANAGEVNYRKGKFYCTNVCGVLLSKEGYANECIAEILNSITKKYVSYVGNPKLMNNVIANISFLVPSSIYEQHKISSFVNSIDDKINKNKDQINKMELWKKGLLQQMFI
jgi:type I restriction enzyme S subunit